MADPLGSKSSPKTKSTAEEWPIPFGAQVLHVEAEAFSLKKDLAKTSRIKHWRLHALGLSNLDVVSQRLQQDLKGYPFWGVAL